MRGFTASPLLDAPRGIAVYLNGVRVNEPPAGRLAVSGVYLRGDEGIADEKTDDSVIVNTAITYQPNHALEVFLSASNLFDAEFETFGLYGEPDEVFPELNSGNNRFLSPNEPRGAWVGARYKW